MGDGTSIEWTNATWNPVRGCSRVSPGCGGANHQGGCYAETIAARFSGPGQPFEGFAKRTKHGGAWTGKLALVDDMLTLPLRWKKPRRIFVNSMSDLFHENLPDEAIDKVFAVMALAPQHTFQCLTKRADRMRAYFAKPLQGPWAGRAFRDDGPATDADWRVRAAVTAMLASCPREALSRCSAFLDALNPDGDGFFRNWPLPNVWLGCSVEDQERADERIPDLLATPAAIRFLSCEPLLGPVRLDGFLRSKPHDTTLDWVIAGGESGHGARPSHPDWFRALRDQCAAAAVPYFFKQWGEWLGWSQFTGADVDDDPEQTRFTTMEWDRGHWADVGHPMWCDSKDGQIDDVQCVGRVGKKAAGAKLDGVEHREFPT